MRIAQVATVSAPVCDRPSGSVEGLVWLLSERLQRRGHEVTVFATADSGPPCELVATLPGPYGESGSPDDWRLCEWINLCRAVEAADEFDVIHSHAYLWGLPLGPLSACPLVHTMHVHPYQASAALWRAYPDAQVTAISAYQWSEFGDLHPVAVIPHGVDPERHTLCSQPGDYLCYLGRFTADKGALEAIAAARELDLQLRIAGPYNEYFRQHVEPLVDGAQIQYLGFVGPRERDELLGGARALVYPVQAPEPFGLVLVEAMLCGTPVAALGHGAVPEIVEEGVTGAWEPPGGDISAALQRSFFLDRAGVRARALRRFSPEAMAASYEAVFEVALSPALS